ncbi:MAG TPA: HAD family hydrolase [Candidatus Baltobacteraceae bacterium]|nr:HAD family hydrolase [Candidatus Baltobacteraceae bacterium]
MPKRRDWAVVLDLDGTLIPKAMGALMRLVADFGLGAEARDEVGRIRAAYSGMFNAGQLSDAQYRAWLLEEFATYVRFNLKREAWRAAIAHVRLREGVLDLIRDLHAAGIPVCVVSAASADFAEYVLETNGVLHMLDAVYAGRLVHDQDDVVVGWDDGTLVTVGNKGFWSRAFADGHGVPHERIIAVGDSPGDFTIGHLRSHRLLIAETHDEALVLLGLDFAEEVIITVSFEPVAAWIRRRVGLPF